MDWSYVDALEAARVRALGTHVPTVEAPNDFDDEFWAGMADALAGVQPTQAELDEFGPF